MTCCEIPGILSVITQINFPPTEFFPDGASAAAVTGCRCCGMAGTSLKLSEPVFAFRSRCSHPTRLKNARCNFPVDVGIRQQQHSFFFHHAPPKAPTQTPTA